MLVVGFLILIGVIITGVGVYISIRAFQTQTWIGNSGIVVVSQIEASGSGSARKTRQKVIVEHVVVDETYQAHMRIVDISFEKRFTDRYPIVTELDFFYNPENPEEGVFQKGITFRELLLLGIGLACIVAAVIVSTRKERKRD